MGDHLRRVSKVGLGQSDIQVTRRAIERASKGAQRAGQAQGGIRGASRLVFNTVHQSLFLSSRRLLPESVLL